MKKTLAQISLRIQTQSGENTVSYFKLMFALVARSMLLRSVLHIKYLRACARGNMSTKSIQLLQEAKEKKMPLDAFIYTATIDGKH